MHSIHLTAMADGMRLEQTEPFSGLLVGRLTEGVIEETERNFATRITLPGLKSGMRHKFYGSVIHPQFGF
jgi:hypothetical protein